jgi:zinc and cadmium transporter
MFFMERFFCFHHHDAPGDDDHNKEHGGAEHADRDHAHDLSWSGAALGLAVHSFLNGIALAAAVQHSEGTRLAGLGTFLVIFLHKPFDAMMIGTLMARGGWSPAWRHTVNALFSLAIPVGAVLFLNNIAANAARGAPVGIIVSSALAFSAGTFLCISLSDLLPELQFHQHDRVKLSLALLAGLAVAYAVSKFESAYTPHSHAPRAADSAASGDLTPTARAANRSPLTSLA